MYHQFKELADVDITKGPMEVGPTCHYMMGGIKVEAETAASTIPGLYAAGEAAAGLHGANRLGGNSLSDLVVFGRRAGEAAAKYAASAQSPKIDDGQVAEAERELLAPFERTGGESPYAVHRDLQETMQFLVGIFRVEEDLKKALAELVKLKERAAKASVEGSRMFNPGWHLAFDLRNMLIVSEAVAMAALARKESRGAHSRIDYSGLDDQWGKQNNIIKQVSGIMTLTTVTKPPIPTELQAILDEA
jgi:succinate dehydrogenase / fumarate reductase flavoprotein subunit